MTSDDGMDKDPTRKATDKIRPGAGPSAAEESLTDALNGLEQILEQRQRAPAAVPKPDTKQPNRASSDAQYTIPLLHDVVVPGVDDAAGRIAESGPGGDMRAPEVDDEEACQKLAERLANEIEVIVQARVEAAVGEATREIREQVRNHLEIMLPEIIEELNALGRR
jgi:hypothetical protein